MLAHSGCVICVWSLLSLCSFIYYYILGNFGFGIDEHIDLGIKYDTSTGIFGMDFYVVLTRAGKRVIYRKAKRARMGLHHKVTKEEIVY